MIRSAFKTETRYVCCVWVLKMHQLPFLSVYFTFSSYGRDMKVYNEKEIGSILTRATELSQDDASRDSMGLSLEELEQLGREAGIPPDLIRKAAAETGVSRARRKEKNWFGGPVSYSNELIVDGEISPDDWEEMLLEIRNTFKEPGAVATRENTYEWTIQSAAVKAQVTARTDEGKTKINVFWAEPTAPTPFYIPTIIGTIISLPISFEALGLSAFPGLLVVLATMLTMVMLGRFGVSSYTERKARNLDQMMTAIELIGVKGQRPSTSRSKPLTAEKAAPKRIPLDGTEDAEEAERSPIRNQNRA